MTWPQYSLRDEEKWPINGTLNLNTIYQISSAEIGQMDRGLHGLKSGPWPQGLLQNMFDKPSPDIMDDDYSMEGMLALSLSLLLIDSGYSYCMWGRLPHSFLGLIAMIIRANRMWLVYLWTGTLRLFQSSCWNSFCFREVPSLFWHFWLVAKNKHVCFFQAGSPLSLPSGLLSSSSLGGGTSPSSRFCTTMGAACITSSYTILWSSCSYPSYQRAPLPGLEPSISDFPTDAPSKNWQWGTRNEWGRSPHIQQE